MPQTTAYLGRGTKLYVKNPSGGAYVEILQARSVEPPGGESEEIEITNLSSDGKEFLSDLPDFGEFSFEQIWDPAKADSALIRDLAASKELTDWRIIFPDAGSTQFDFSGTVRTRRPLTIAQNEPLVMSVVVRVSGEVVES